MVPFSVYIFGNVASNVFEANFSMIDQENLCHISVFFFFLTISLPYYYLLLPYCYCSDTICDSWWHLKTPLAYVNNLIPVHLVMDRRSSCPLGWRLLVTRWDKLQLTPSFSKYGLILVYEIEGIYAVTIGLERFTIWHCGMGQPSARLSRNSIAQFCVWTDAQFEVTNDTMLTVSPLYLSLCKLQNCLHNSTFKSVPTLLFPNKNTIKLLYARGIVKIFCLIWCIWLNSCFTPSQSKISSYILSLTVWHCRILLFVDKLALGEMVQELATM